MSGKYTSMPQRGRNIYVGQEWRIPFLRDLVYLRNGPGDIPKPDIDHMIDFICCQ